MFYKGMRDVILCRFGKECEIYVRYIVLMLEEIRVGDLPHLPRESRECVQGLCA